MVDPGRFEDHRLRSRAHCVPWISGIRCHTLQEQYGTACTAHRVDVTDSDSVNAWVSNVAAGHGRIDVLINNAGIIRDNKIDDIDDIDWHAVVDTSMTGSFYCTRAVLPRTCGLDSTAVSSRSRP